MKLYQIVLPREDIKHLTNLRDLLEAKFQMLRAKEIDYRVMIRKERNYVVFCCLFWSHQTACNINMFDSIREVIACCVAEFIVRFKERELLMEILVEEYGYHNEQEMNAILTMILYFMYCYETDENDKRVQRLKEKISGKASQYLLQEQVLSLDGFIRFRLKELWEEWREAAEHGIDEYLMDKEYKEFIRLLRYLLSIQEPKIDLLHVIHIDEQNLQLFNQEWNPVAPYTIHDLTYPSLGWQLQYEDMIIHTLIMLAPCKIILHTDQANHHIPYMIKKIFEKNVQVCSACSMCHSRRTQTFR